MVTRIKIWALQTSDVLLLHEYYTIKHSYELVLQLVITSQLMKPRSVAVKRENRSCVVWVGRSVRCLLCIENGVHLRKVVRCLLHCVCRSDPSALLTNA
jgi:hypothetical protein